MTRLFLFWLAACSMGGGDGDTLDENLIRTAERGMLVDEVSEAGKITPRYDVDIKTKVSGEILAVHVEEGQVVHQGDLLVEVVATEYGREVAMQRVALQQARLEAERSEVERGRKAQALATHGIAEAEYDVAAREAAMAKLAVESAQLRLQSAEDQLAYTRVTAPIDGVIIVRNVEAGEVVTAGITATVNGVPQLTIAQMDRLLLEIDLNQVDVAKVKRDQVARIFLDAYPGVEVPGVVSQIAAAGHRDDTRGIDVFKVKVEVDPTKATVEIKPGMTAEVRISIGSWPDVVKLPAESVFEADGKSWVFAVITKEGKKAKERVEIKLGHRSDREVEVTSGFEAGNAFYAQAEIKDLAAKLD